METAQHTNTMDNEQDTYETKHKQNKQKNTQIIHWDTLWYNTENNISECDNLPSEDIKITTNCICHSDTTREGTVFNRQANTKQRRV
jgi:hypothetical protein